MFGYKLRTLSESIGTFANLFRSLNGYLSSSPITKDLIFLSCISTYLVCNSFRIAILVDSLEQPIYRDSDQKEQQKYFSGKKRQHTLKSLMIRSEERRVGKSVD